MPSKFFHSTPIARAGHRLEAIIAEACKQRWTEHLAITPFDNLEPPIHRGELIADQSKIRKASQAFRLFRGKDHFTWDIIILGLWGKASEKEIANTRQQYVFLSELLQTIQAINVEILAANPNYQSIIGLAQELQRECYVPSTVSGGGRVLINLKFFGNNFLEHCLYGIFGLIHAPIMALLGVLCVPQYALAQFKDSSKGPEYCGSPQFFYDTAVYFCTSVCKVLAAILFPLAMLHEQYTTNSCNILKGDAERALETIIHLAQQQLKRPVESDLLHLGPPPTVQV